MNDLSTKRPRVIAIMGVAGAGKTRIGRLLSTALGWPFHDGDDYHSRASIEKMAHGEGLTDADRAPWLETLRLLIAGVIEQGGCAVLACSALKQSYRDLLVAGLPDPGLVRFVYLEVPREVLEQRLATRRGHFVHGDLLDSQLQTLEEPRDAVRVDGTREPSEIVRRIRTELAE